MKPQNAKDCKKAGCKKTIQKVKTCGCLQTGGRHWCGGISTHKENSPLTKTTKVEHAVTPWRVDVNGYVCTNDLQTAIMVQPKYGGSREDAEFIVRAVNSHEELLATLKGAEKVLRKFLPVLEQHTDDEGMLAGEWLDEIKEVVSKFEAVAKAEGGND